MRGLDRILELQDLDTAIDRLEQRREQLEAGEELSSLRKEMEEADARLGELRLASDSISSESTCLEHEIASMSDKLHAEEKRMYDGSIANAKELEALQHEIANLKERRSRAEDELLEQMVRKEDVEARAALAQTEAETARARVEEVGGTRSASSTRSRPTSPHGDPNAGRSFRPSTRSCSSSTTIFANRSTASAPPRSWTGCARPATRSSALELDRLRRTEGVKRCEYCRRIVVLA